MCRLERNSPNDLFQDHPDPASIGQEQHALGLPRHPAPSVSLFRDFNPEWGMLSYVN